MSIHVLYIDHTNIYGRKDKKVGNFMKKSKSQLVLCLITLNFGFGLIFVEDKSLASAWVDDSNEESWLEYFYSDTRNIPGNPDEENPSPMVVPSSEYNQKPEIDLTELNKIVIDNKAVLKVFHQLINRERIINGLPTLEYGLHLQEAAENRNLEIINQFSHTRPNGLAFYTASGFEKAGANVAENLQFTQLGINTDSEEIAFELFTNWKNSPSHYENMLNALYTAYALQIKTYQQSDTLIIYSTQILSD